MKPKKITKKLSFSKSTIANLNAAELSNVKGAIDIGTEPYWTGRCITCAPTCDTYDNCGTYDTCDTCDTCVYTCNTCNYTCNHTPGTGCVY